MNFYCCCYFNMGIASSALDRLPSIKISCVCCNKEEDGCETEKWEHNDGGGSIELREDGVDMSVSQECGNVSE